MALIPNQLASNGKAACNPAGRRYRPLCSSEPGLSSALFTQRSHTPHATRDTKSSTKIEQATHWSEVTSHRFSLLAQWQHDRSLHKPIPPQINQLGRSQTTPNRSPKSSDKSEYSKADQHVGSRGPSQSARLLAILNVTGSSCRIPDPSGITESTT